MHSVRCLPSKQGGGASVYQGFLKVLSCTMVVVVVETEGDSQICTHCQAAHHFWSDTSVSTSSTLNQRR